MARKRVEPAAMAVGSLPTKLDLSLYQGDDFYLQLIVDNGGQPVDLTGYTPKAQIRSTPGSGTVIANFTISTVSTNALMLHLPSVEATKVPSTAAWDVQITDSGGAVTTLAYGQVTSAREVTT